MKRLKKQFNDIRLGRVSIQREALKARVTRTRLERRNYKELRAVFSKWLNGQAYMYREFGVYEPVAASLALREALLPTMQQHIKRVFAVIYEGNEQRYFSVKQEALVFGRNQDIDLIVARYFQGRIDFLDGLSARLSEKIKRIIEEGQLDGDSLQVISRRLVNTVGALTLSRAATIARTETHSAASFAHDQYYETVQADTGIEMKKKWVATNDERTRSTHFEMNSKPSIDMSEKFEVGGVRMKYAGDPAGGPKNVINCRCNIIYLDARDMEED